MTPSDSVDLLFPLPSMLVLEMTPSQLPQALAALLRPRTRFMQGTGADSVLITDGQNLTVYADSSAADTAGGADSLQVTALTSSTVYGAAGGDTLNLTAASNVRFDLGAGTNYATGGGTYTSSTLIGGAAVDKLIVGGVTGGGLRLVELVLTPWSSMALVHGNNATTLATILGGTGADTLDFNKKLQNATVLGGTDTASLINATTVVTSHPARWIPATTPLLSLVLFHR